jgi:hypothetical protein
VSNRLRVHSDRLVAAPPAGVRIRTRLRVSSHDQHVLRQVGQHLARLAGRDLAERCRVGLGDVNGSRRAKALTAASTSRWAATAIANGSGNTATS